MDIREYQAKQNEIRHPWEQARLEVIYRLLGNYLPKNGGSILDVGCGDTFVVNELHKRLPDTAFFAIDKAFTPELIQKFSSEGIVLANSIESVQDRIEKADIILLMDVIEHIKDEKSFLRELREMSYVSPDSVFLITVPAYQRLFSAHDEFLQHYRRYSRKALKDTLRASGFEIISSGNFFISLLAPRLGQVAKERVAGRKKVAGLADWKGSARQAKLLKEILLLDFKISSGLQKAGLKLPGLSTYALCRKSVS